MDTSILLARLIGPLFVAVGVGVLLNPAHYGRMLESFLTNSELYYFSGAVAFVIGMAVILHHNLWTANWRVVITIIGWMSLIKGIARGFCFRPSARGLLAPSWHRGGALTRAPSSCWWLERGFPTRASVSDA